MDKKEKQAPAKEEKKAAPILVQMGIFAAILFVAQLISDLFPASFNATDWDGIALHSVGSSYR